MDNSASLRGQVIMWHRFLTQAQRHDAGLFAADGPVERGLRFGDPPSIPLRTRVPEDVWGAPKQKIEESSAQMRLLG